MVVGVSCPTITTPQGRADRHVGKTASSGVTVHTSHHGVPRESTLDKLAHNDAAERFRVWNAPNRPIEARVVERRGDTPALPTVHLAPGPAHGTLDAAVSHPVTLLCAPTGWKTALVASWIYAGRAPGRAAYVRFEVNCGATAWRQLTNALTAAGIAVDPATYAWSNAHHHERAVVVLDDLHHVTNHTVLRRLERLITRLGDRISFLILARTEPPLSLYRWRVRGQLDELRTDHLALTQDEVAGLADGYGVRLAQHFRYALWHVTEGWPAAVAVILPRWSAGTSRSGWSPTSSSARPASTRRSGSANMSGARSCSTSTRRYARSCCARRSWRRCVRAWSRRSPAAEAAPGCSPNEPGERARQLLRRLALLVSLP